MAGVRQTTSAGVVETSDSGVPTTIAETILDDFEDGDISSDPAWTGDTGSYTVTANGTINGSNELSADSNFNTIVIDNSSLTSDGNEYLSWWQTSSGATTSILVGSQSLTSPLDNCWWVIINPNSGTSGNLQLIKRVDGSSDTTTSASDIGVEEGTNFKIAVRYNSSDTTAVAYNSSGSELATTSQSDTSYRSGAVGVRSEGDSGGTWLWDDITESPL